LIPLWKAEISQFNDASGIAESILFINKILAHYTGSTEKNFISWGKSLSNLIEDKAEYKKLINEIKLDDNFAIKCNKTLVKIMSIELNQENIVSKIKSQMYSNMKTHMKALIEYEFEF
jgi:hypothetical protein